MEAVAKPEAVGGGAMTALARRSDPYSSHRAAFDVTASGVACSQSEWFLHAVRQHPGLTASELAELSGVYDRYQANRRLADLCREGLVEKGDARPGLSGRLEVTWAPVREASAPGSDGAQGVLL